MGINDLLNKYFAGTGEYTLKMELLGILRDLTEEDPDSPDTQRMVSQVCDALVTFLSKYGKTVSKDKCMDDVINALREERAKIVARALFDELRRSRGGKRSSGGGSPSLLP